MVVLNSLESEDVTIRTSVCDKDDVMIRLSVYYTVCVIVRMWMLL